MNYEIRSLTGLRGIAALLVAIFHIHQPSGDSWLSTFFRHGYLAVTLFFVLSGFVMALTYGAMFRNGFSGRAYGAFLVKRIARIYPLNFLVTATIACLAVLAGVQSVEGQDFSFVVAANLLMVQAWGMAPSLNHVSWSISTEWAAYLLFPWLAIGLMYGRKPFVAAWAGVCAISIAVVALTNSLGAGPLNIFRFDSPGPTVLCIACFSLGIVAYRYRRARTVCKWLGNSLAFTLLCLSVLGLMCIPSTDIVIALTFPALVIGLSFESGRLSRFIGSKAIYSLGEWSYSLYMIHLPFYILQEELTKQLTPVLQAGANILATVITLVIVTALSAFTYRTIEKPSRSFLQSLLRPRERSAEQSGNAT